MSKPTQNNDINFLTQKILTFRDKRDWKQFNTLKDMAISLSLETGEVLEHFQWRNNKELDTYLEQNKSAVAEELADVLYWTLLLSHDLEIDIKEAFEEKMKQNEQKYPVDKSKGKHTKYNKL
jgi:NTP pyrophosphatase (non-canonical NTP hydrolase)